MKSDYRKIAIVFLCAVIALVDFTFMLGTVRAETDPISLGLVAERNQAWQQGEESLAGTPEGHVLLPTGGSGSFRTRGDEFGAAVATGDFNGDGLAAPDEDAETSNVGEGSPYESLRKGDGAITVIYGSLSANGLSSEANHDQMYRYQ